MIKHDGLMDCQTLLHVHTRTRMRGALCDLLAASSRTPKATGCHVRDAVAHCGGPLPPCKARFVGMYGGGGGRGGAFEGFGEFNPH